MQPYLFTKMQVCFWYQQKFLLPSIDVPLLSLNTCSYETLTLTPLTIFILLPYASHIIFLGAKKHLERNINVIMMKSSKDKIYANQGNAEVLSEVTENAKFILDIGCGNGDNARLLKKISRQIHGITLSEKEAENAKDYCDRIFIHNCENGLPQEVMQNKYDAIICSHVLEHIAYPETLLQNIKEVLSRTGIVIIALPNIFHYKSRIELMLGNFYFEDSGIWDNTHLRWYTFESAKLLLLNNQFTLVKSYVSGDIPYLTLFRFIPVKVRKSIFKFLSKISPGLFGVQIILVAKGSPD